MTMVTQDGSASRGAWGNRNFRRLWAASTVGSFGSEVAELALPLLALLTLSATAAEVGVLRVAQFVPFLLATLPLGLLVDRRRRQRLALMVGADLGRFALVASIPLAVALGVVQMELLYLVVLLTGTLTVLHQVADFALLPSVVAEADLVDANGKIAASTSANEIGGRGLGGVLVELISAPFAVAVNAVAFLISGLTLRRIRLAEQSTADDATAAPARARTSRKGQRGLPADLLGCDPGWSSSRSRACVARRRADDDAGGRSRHHACDRLGRGVGGAAAAQYRGGPRRLTRPGPATPPSTTGPRCAGWGPWSRTCSSCRTAGSMWPWVRC